jgi:hypothetical protein
MSDKGKIILYFKMKGIVFIEILHNYNIHYWLTLEFYLYFTLGSIN